MLVDLVNYELTKNRQENNLDQIEKDFQENIQFCQNLYEKIETYVTFI